MIQSSEAFIYEDTSSFEATGLTIKVQPFTPDYLAWRLGISQEEAEDMHGRRVEHQREKLPRFIGEFIVPRLGYGGIGLQMAHISALKAHHEALGLGAQVYGGYRGMNFLRHGTLFGPFSDEFARDIEARNQFHAAQLGSWREQAGYAKNNPFDHMTRGERLGQSAPILATFARSMLHSAYIRHATITPERRQELLTLEAAGEPLPQPYWGVPPEWCTQDRREPVSGSTAYWEPQDDLKIEDTVQVVYHRGEI